MTAESKRAHGFRMPAEWEPHEATWIAWPHNREDWPGRFSPIPWVYTIAHRTCLDEIRRRKRSRVRLTNDGTLAAEPAADLTGGSAESASESVDRGDAASAAMAALERLPDNQREALILTKVHGRSHAEAAMITGTTPGAIKLRAHRAYVSLRQMLGNRREKKLA